MLDLTPPSFPLPSSIASRNSPSIWMMPHMSVIRRRILCRRLSPSLSSSPSGDIPPPPAPEIEQKHAEAGKGNVRENHLRPNLLHTHKSSHLLYYFILLLLPWRSDAHATVDVLLFLLCGFQYLRDTGISRRSDKATRRTLT